MQAAIGRCQLRKLDEWVSKRRKNAQMLNQAFASEKALRLTLPGADIFHSYYKYYVFVRPEMLKESWNRDRIMAEVNEAGVPCYSGSCSEIYLEKAFEELREDTAKVISTPLNDQDNENDNDKDKEASHGDARTQKAQRIENDKERKKADYDNDNDFRLKVARELGETSLMLLVHPTLTGQNVQDTIEVVRRVVSAAAK
jgi:dTDP-4-amino-4,6-dideoxygalactose transaminase